MRCVSRKLCLCGTTTFTPVPAGRIAFRMFKVLRSKIDLAIAFTIFPAVPPSKGRAFTGPETLLPTSAAKMFWYRKTSTTSAVEPEDCLTIYSLFATKRRGIEATRTRHSSINLFRGFAPLSRLLGNSTVGPITLSNGVQFLHVGAAHPESSTMNSTQTANPVVNTDLARKAARGRLPSR